MIDPHPDWLVPAWPAPPGVHALVTTRAGGRSQGPWGANGGAGGLNLGVGGDAPASVEANRRRLRDSLPGAPCWLEQVHGTADRRRRRGRARHAGRRLLCHRVRRGVRSAHGRLPAGTARRRVRSRGRRGACGLARTGRRRDTELGGRTAGGDRHAGRPRDRLPGSGDRPGAFRRRGRRAGGDAAAPARCGAGLSPRTGPASIAPTCSNWPGRPWHSAACTTCTAAARAPSAIRNASTVIGATHPTGRQAALIWRVAGPAPSATQRPLAARAGASR